MSTDSWFDANEVEPVVDFEPIPEGEYVAIVTASEEKPTKSGNGTYLELTFQVIEGEYKERLLWSRLNLDNPNPLAVKMAKGHLSAICRAVGVMTPNDPVELHDLPLLITVKCKKREDNGEMTNVIKGYTKKDGPPAQPQHAASGTPPWKR